MGGHDPYSSSKGCAELVTAAYRRSFFAERGAGLASARAGNVIGGGDWAEDRLVPDMVRAAVRGDAVRIRNPGALRPWQHVLEPLAGYLMLAQRLAEAPARFAEGWNFGPDDSDVRPVSWVVERFIAALGAKAKPHFDDGGGPHEANLLKLDSSRAHSLLGWRPRWALEHALQLTADWYKAHASGAPMRERSLAQVEAYGDALALGESQPS
jgi:CDP-glucose 4,6-dehydratase